MYPPSQVTPDPLPELASDGNTHHAPQHPLKPSSSMFVWDADDKALSGSMDPRCCVEWEIWLLQREPQLAPDTKDLRLYPLTVIHKCLLRAS